MASTDLGKGDHDTARLTSCGRPSAFIRAALLGEDGTPVAQGEPGESCVSGPLLAGGYWNLPDETAATFRDCWMHTGDVAREAEEGSGVTGARDRKRVGEGERGGVRGWSGG